MNESDFTTTKVGEVRWGMNGRYCYFQPYELPFDHTISEDVRRRMNLASNELTRLDGMFELIDKETIEMLTTNLSLRESTSSSSIEGTMSTVDDIFRSEKVPENDKIKSEDNQEIVNYRKALLQGFEELPVGGKIDIDFIKSLHRTLMYGVRGSDKSPGEFKTEQNAIGNMLDTLETAKMVPAPPESVCYLLDNWLEYVNSDSIDTMEKVAMAHYQFEAIHPFRDGNGRVGRLLALMILRRDGLLKQPVLYISGYLNSRRGRYVDMLYEVSSKSSIDEWLSFLSDGFTEQAKSTADTVRSLISCRNKLRSMAVNLDESKVIDMLFRNPYVTSKDIIGVTGVSMPTAVKILGRLESAGILREITGRSRNRVYCADGILEILR